MRTFLINSERPSMNRTGVHPDMQSSGVALPAPALDLETFTRCAPILISDDEPQIAHLYQVLMARVRLHTVLIADGYEALDYMLHKPVSLVISDLLKPNITGIDMLRALRQDPTTTEIPFVIITATPEYESRQMFKMLGGSAYLTKPIDARQFTQTVTQLLTAQLTDQPVQYAAIPRLSN